MYGKVIVPDRSVRTGRRLLVTGTVVILIAVAYYLFTSARLEIRRTSERERIVQAIEDYYSSHGRYPERLADAGALPDPELFHFWCEIVGDNRQPTGFTLDHGGLILHHEWEYYYDTKEWFHTATH